MSSEKQPATMPKIEWVGKPNIEIYARWREKVALRRLGFPVKCTVVGLRSECEKSENA